MLSLGTTVPELEQKPFENGFGAARAALRRECAQRSRDTCLAQSAALPRASPMPRLETTETCSQVSSPRTSRPFATSGPRTLTKTQAGQSSCAARAHRARALQRRKRLRASILAIALTAAVSNTTENRCVRALEAFSQQQSQCIAQSSLRTAPPLLPHCACHCARQCACNERS